jgi:hypothetical protein
VFERDMAERQQRGGKLFRQRRPISARHGTRCD